MLRHRQFFIYCYLVRIVPVCVIFISVEGILFSSFHLYLQFEYLRTANVCRQSNRAKHAQNMLSVIKK